ncbi:hypothetical protein E2651_02480 [Streptomyces sp. MZ04]|nr:hypothetical protein E2651_02480 [Streptomyces sp. MZ04]
MRPGTQQPVGDGSWTVTLRRLERLSAGTVPEVPAGSSAYRVRITVTNERPQVATAPRIAVTARYGHLGRQATEVKTAATAASPGADEPVRIRPNGSADLDVRLAFPDRAQGRQVTVTVEATPEGLAEPELLFFESALQGRPATSPQAQGSRDAEGRQGLTPLGQWNAGLRLSSVSVTGHGASRSARLEVSVANRTGAPMPGLGTTLRVLTGRDLHLATTVRPVYGYHDAAIAPHHCATQAVVFRIPESAVGGPVTIEAVSADGSRVTFEGQLG